MSARRQGGRNTAARNDGLWGCFSAPEVEACLQRGEHPERPNPHGGPEGSTPLHRACRSGLLAVAQALLRGGAKATARDSNGESPLHALLSPHNLTNPLVQQKILSSLLEHGADVLQADSHGNTALHLAAMKGNLRFCERLLAAGGSLAAGNMEGRTPASILLAAMPRLAEQDPWRERLFAVTLQEVLPRATPASRRGA